MHEDGAVDGRRALSSLVLSMVFSRDGGVQVDTLAVTP